MTGFEEVEKLKELEQNLEKPEWLHDSGCSADENFVLVGGGEPDFIIAMRNAAPLLLDIAGQIRPGDDKLLAQLVYEQEDLARFMAGFGGVRQSERVMIAMLKRYQKMAERMHEASCSGLNRP